jgi:hypothetical protein
MCCMTPGRTIGELNAAFDLSILMVLLERSNAPDKLRLGEDYLPNLTVEHCALTFTHSGENSSLPSTLVNLCATHECSLTDFNLEDPNWLLLPAHLDRTQILGG